MYTLTITTSSAILPSVVHLVVLEEMAESDAVAGSIRIPHQLTRHTTLVVRVPSCLLDRRWGRVTVNRLAYALLRILFLLGLAAWGYVIAMELRGPDSVFDVLALWVPIRLDYFGEAAFILSMVTYFLLKFWETKK